jgi:peptidoglycan/LPS O-acetylase OafA/YrhL
MPIYWFFPTLLLALAVGLIGWNVRSWRAARREEASDAEELEFSRRQFRRRLQVSGMLAGLAVAMVLGQFIPHLKRPTLYVLFWFGVLLVLGWIVLLAMGDLVVGRRRLAKFHEQRKIEEARLNAELERIRSQFPDRNGDHQQTDA